MRLFCACKNETSENETSRSRSASVVSRALSHTRVNVRGVLEPAISSSACGNFGMARQISVERIAVRARI